MILSLVGIYFCAHSCISIYRNYSFSVYLFLGKIGGPSVVKSVKGPSTPLFAKLQSKIGATLPSSRVQEFRSLCSAFKVNYVCFLGEEVVCFCLTLFIIL